MIYCGLELISKIFINYCLDTAPKTFLAFNILYTYCGVQILKYVKVFYYFLHIKLISAYISKVIPN
jgi:hypothetical protein